MTITPSDLNASVTYDPQTDRYIIRYTLSNGSIHITKLELPNKINPRVKAEVENNPVGESLLYRYTILVGQDSVQNLVSFYAPFYKTFSSQIVPTGWFGAEMQGKHLLSWFWDVDQHFSYEEIVHVRDIGLKIDEEQGGFSFISEGLPGIVTVYFKGEPRVFTIWEEAPPVEIEDELNKFTIFPGGTVQRNTVGPIAPPQNFVPLDFINYIIDLRTQAQTNLWITQPSIIPILDAKLSTTKSNLVANNNSAAVTDINDFINEVENQRLSGLTSEGYALLKFNALYLRNQLLGMLPSDTLPPITTATVSPSPNDSGWNQTDVNITLTAADNSGGSGVKEIRYILGAGAELIAAGSSVVIPLTTEGEIPLRYYAVDQAGNSETEKTATIRIDKTPPVITTAANPPANAAGWNNSDVTVSFSATDSLSGNPICTPATAVVSIEGANQSIGTTCRDQAGNNSSTSYQVNLDKTAPTLTFGPLSPPANTAGWNRGDVTISFSASDSLSGLFSMQPAASPLVFATDGTGMVQNVTVTDKAGNSATFTSPAVNRDTIPPTLTFGTASPLPNAAGWNNTNVSVPFTTQDERSGVAGSSLLSPLVLSAEGSSVAMNVTVTDQAGNQATFTSPAYKIDKTAPVLTLPSLAASYLLNSTLSLSFSASDALSEVNTVGGTLNGAAVSSGASVLLSQVGVNSFMFTASDQAGNGASENHPFSVLYGFGGFLPPLNPNAIYQLGRTLPTKFQLTDANGAIVSTAVAHLHLQQLSGTEPVGDPVDASSNSAADSDNLFRFDGSHYHYNLDTGPLSAGTWQLRAVLNDGSTRTIPIGLKTK